MATPKVNAPATVKKSKASATDPKSSAKTAKSSKPVVMKVDDAPAPVDSDNDDLCSDTPGTTPEEEELEDSQASDNLTSSESDIDTADEEKAIKENSKRRKLASELSKQERKVAQLLKKLDKIQDMAQERKLKHKEVISKFRQQLNELKHKKKKKRSAAAVQPWVEALTQASKDLKLGYTIFPKGTPGHALAMKYKKKILKRNRKARRREHLASSPTPGEDPADDRSPSPVVDMVDCVNDAIEDKFLAMVKRENNEAKSPASEESNTKST